MARSERDVLLCLRVLCASAAACAGDNASRPGVVVDQAIGATEGASMTTAGEGAAVLAVMAASARLPLGGARGLTTAAAGTGAPAVTAARATSAGMSAMPAAVAGTATPDAGRGAAGAIATAATSRSTGAAGASAVASAGTVPWAAGAPGPALPTAGATARPDTWRIELLGDSITETSCTSQLVFAKLRAGGHANFDLVGTRRNEQGCGVEMPDRDCEGHSGYLVTELAAGGPKAAEPAMWANADRADVVLMHLGTNDAWNGGVPIAKVLEAYSAVLASLRAVQPNVVVFVAQIIPLRPDGCADCEGRARTLNGQIPGWAMAESRAESPVIVVDQWSGFDVVADTNDRVHPNLVGAQKMADAWIRALYAHGIF